MQDCATQQLFGFCPRCNKILPWEAFYAAKRLGKTTLSAWCIVCTKRYKGRYKSVTIDGVRYYVKLKKGKVG